MFIMRERWVIWKGLIKEFKRELEKEFPVRGADVVKDFMVSWMEDKGWSEVRKRSIIESMTVFSSGELFFRDELGKLHIVRDVIDYHGWGLEDIREYAIRKTEEFWGIEFDCEIKLVSRDWKRMLGSMRYYYEDDRVELVFSDKVNKRRKLDNLKNTIKHELVHWYLWKKGLPHSDEDEEFVREIRRLGIGESGTKKVKEAYEKYSS